MAGSLWWRPDSSPWSSRNEVLEVVRHLVGRAQDGHLQGLLIEGPSGSGKTNVLQAVVDDSRDRGFCVLSGHALPVELPTPFSLVRALAGSLNRGGDASSSASDPPGDPSPLFPDPIGRTASSPAPATNGKRDTEDTLDGFERLLTPRGPGPLAGLRAGREDQFARIEEYFRSLAQERPLLIAVDDLHLADLSSLEVLRRFTRNLPDAAAAVVATVDPGAAVPPISRSVLDALRRSSAFRTVSLRPLTVTEVAEFARWIGNGQEPDPHDVLRWHAEADGNPLFVEQLVRSARGPGATANGGAPAAGRNVSELMAARLGSLTGDERRLLTYAAVLGLEFDASDLAALAESERAPVVDRLYRLARQGLLRSKGDGAYEFVAEAARTAVYAALTETERRSLHGRAGLVLEARGTASDAELARQFYLGQDDERAVRYNIAAAENDARVFGFETAVAHVSRAIEAERRRTPRDPRTEIRCLTEKGRLLIELSDLRGAEEVLNEALALARAPPGYDVELGRALLGLAQSALWRGEYPTALALATEAEAHPATGRTLQDEMVARRILGVAYLRTGRLAEAEACQRALLAIAERAGTPSEQGHAMIEVANVLSAWGSARFEEALELYTRAAERFGSGEDYGSQARVLMDRAVLEWTVGRFDEALHDLGLAIEAAERSGSRRWIGYCHINLAQLHAELRRPELARPALDRAAKALAPTGDRYASQQIAMGRGMVAQAERDFREAETRYQEALAQARALHQPSETSEVLMRLSELAHERGNDEEARRRLDQARASGLLGLRPDFAPRVAALDRALAAGARASSPGQSS